MCPSFVPDIQHSDCHTVWLGMADVRYQWITVHFSIMPSVPKSCKWSSDFTLSCKNFVCIVSTIHVALPICFIVLS